MNYYNPIKMFGSVFEDGASLLSEVKCIICRSDCKERGQCHPGASTDRFGRRHRGRPESPVVSSGEVYQQRPTGIASGSRGSGNNRKWCEEQVSWSHTSCRRREGSGGGGSEPPSAAKDGGVESGSASVSLEGSFEDRLRESGSESGKEGKMAQGSRNSCSKSNSSRRNGSCSKSGSRASMRITGGSSGSHSTMILVAIAVAAVFLSTGSSSSWSMSHMLLGRGAVLVGASEMRLPGGNLTMTEETGGK